MRRNLDETVIYILYVEYIGIFFAGEYPAAMQHGGQLKLGNPPFVIFLALLLGIFIYDH